VLRLEMMPERSAGMRSDRMQGSSAPTSQAVAMSSLTVAGSRQQEAQGKTGPVEVSWRLEAAGWRWSGDPLVRLVRQSDLTTIPARARPLVGWRTDSASRWR